MSELLGLRLLQTSSVEEVASFEGPVICYSNRVFPGKLCIKPEGLLNETGVRSRVIKTGKWDDLILLFAGNDDQPVPFDIFSASFWMISRYEEYLDFTSDVYGRFPARESLAFRAGFLDVPVVNLWAKKLAVELQRLYPSIQLKKNKFQWLTTIDVDHAWAYLNKSCFRTLGGIATSLYRGKDFCKRIRVLRNKEADPYFTFDEIRELHQDIPHKLFLFFLSGTPGKHDLNVSPEKPEWRALVNSLASDFKIGIHPSFRSNKGFQILNKEFNSLSGLLPYPLINSRQHFLKITFPETYRNLIRLGIQNDYSMGYPGQPGFRAGVCTPFHFYDLHKEEKTSLLVWPITLMDRTFKDYLHTSPDESMDIIQTYIDIIENAGGWFIPVWHNDSLSNFGQWEGWKSLYIRMLETLKNKS
jgi:hypothetical protein